MKKTAWYASILFLVTLSSCISSPGNRNDQSGTLPGTSSAEHASIGTQKQEPDSTQVTTQVAPPVNTIIVTEIESLMSNAKESIEANRLAEGMQFYIAALGRASRAGIASRIEELTGIINAIGAKLTIEPHESWISSDGSQRAGEVRAAARGDGLMPTVYLYESYGVGKSVVPDAMIRFEFVDNEGTLNDIVRTDNRGMANTTIGSIVSPGRDARVRAFPIFSAEGYTYAFRTVFRDFSYRAPTNIALVIALERTPLGFNENPRVLDGVANALKPLGVQTINYNGVLAPDRFMSAFSGDSNELAAFAGSTSPGYFALLFVDVGAPVQMQLQGRLYNIFNATGKATIRIVRADGTIVFAEAKDGIRGQGGTEQASIDDCLVKIRSDMTKLLQDRAGVILKAFFD